MEAALLFFLDWGIVREIPVGAYGVIPAHCRRPSGPGCRNERKHVHGVPAVEAACAGGCAEAAGGEGPMAPDAPEGYHAAMNLIILFIVLLLLFGGGGFYFGGPAIGGGGLGLILLICLIVYLAGGFRSPKT